MCRWITVISSQDLSLSDVVLAPTNSLVKLARDASFHPGYGDENNHVTNGDGFGVGWYHSNVVTVPRIPSLSTDEIEGHKNLYAAVFKDTAPAWNNRNLREICVATRSSCIVAHVRAASPFAPVTQENCHPFKAGRLLFCHNGRIPKFPKIRRAVCTRLTDKAFEYVTGTTDSEALLGLILTFLEEDGKAPIDEDNGLPIAPVDQDTPFGHSRLVQAIKKTFKTVKKIIEEAILSGDLQNYGFSTMNFCLTDGETTVVTRYCDKSPATVPPSLYYAYGNANELNGEITSKNPEEVRSLLGIRRVPFAFLCFVLVKNDLFDCPHMFLTHFAFLFLSLSLQYVMSQLTDNETGPTDDEDEESYGEEKKDDDVASKASSATSDVPSLPEVKDELFDEFPIALLMRESLPGLNYSDVNPADAAFVVASNPLTKTHTWTPMPRNAIMWCTRGKIPELRLLREKKAKHNRILSDNTMLY